MKKILPILMTALLMNSCGLYNKYKRPEVKTDALFGDTTQLAKDTSSIGNLHWRELFTDYRLQQLIEKGLSNNTDLRIAYLRITEAEATLQSARLAYLPAVSLEPQGTVSRSGHQNTNKSYQLAASASWEIDLFGKLTNAKRGAQASLLQNEAYRQAVQTKLIATIANSYYSLLMLDKQLAITRKTAVNWGENVKTLRAFKEAGQTTEAAVSQAEANRLSVEASILTIGRQIAETENSLSALLADVPQQIERTTLEEQSFPAELSVGVPLDLLSNRPDVQQSEFALAQAFYSTNQARSAFYPGITLSGSAGWTNNGGGIISNPGSWLFQAVGMLVQPLFNKGTNVARLKIAKAQQEEAVLTFQQSLLDAGSEVNNALTQWQTARERIVITKEQVSSLETAVKSTRLLMTHGSTTYLEVLTAQQTLL